MPTPVHRYLKEIFTNHLHFTPTPGLIASFERDLACANPSLMKASLLEVKDAGKLKGVRDAEVRGVIFSVYNRKLAEQSRMFPVFHAFETAFRSILAIQLEALYGAPDWWRPIEHKLRRGERLSPLTRIDGKPMSQDALATLGHLLRSELDRPDGATKLVSLTDGYGLMAVANLQHVQKLFVQHWGPLLSVFRANRAGSPPMTKQVFDDQFSKIREARNDVYHHNSTRDLGRVTEIVEDLLDRLDINLSFTMTQVSAAKPRPITFRMPREARHHIY